MIADLVEGADGRPRCGWCGGAPDYAAYHDDEWGRPVADDTRLFEKLVLEGFQSGLSWLTILRKREGFRAGFAGFEIDRVAEFGEADVARLLADAGIVRHRGKIEAAIENAKAARRLRERTSLAAFVWRHEPAARPAPARMADVPPSAPASVALAKALKAEGFRFVGPTTAYAFMQAMGLVNDHLEGCSCRAAVETVRRDFVRPR